MSSRQQRDRSAERKTQAGVRTMNWTAISMFMVFVCFTLLVTRWAACAPARPAISTPPAVA
jgi:hypothetical protein